MTSTKCNPLCLECSDLDVNICSVCRTGVFQYNNLCYDRCPEGAYPDREWQVCRLCDPDCPICWGPRSDMCGAKEGVKTNVVLLENEIKNYFTQKEFNNDDMINWINKLNVIIHKVGEIPIPNLITFGLYGPSQLRVFESSRETLSTEDVYNSDKIEVELPIGSFSRNNGVFVPIPSHINDKMELVNSNWIFIKGNWNGRGWSPNWFPKLPSFIKFFGERNKIYFENGGYWIYEHLKDWRWMKSSALKVGKIPINELLSDLNTIKINMGDFNTKKVQQKISLRKLQIEDNIRHFFDKFTLTNKLIFSKLSNTVNNEENNIMGSLEFLKKRIDLFLAEEMMLDDRVGGKINYPVSNMNFRKDEKKEQEQEQQEEEDKSSVVISNTFSN